MLSIDDPGKGHTSSAYYWDYYNLECIVAAEWFNTGAEIFGLNGEPDRVTFNNFRAGRTPDGTLDLVKNAGHPQRDTHWDLTFSAPKSVSVLYALGSEEDSRQIVEAHKFAVLMALKYMEEYAAINRHGQGGVIREHCATVGCLFTHDTSREHDMQLHSHAILMNVGIRADGGTGALHSVELFRHKMTAGQVYQDTFAQELTRRLGLAIEKEEVGFHIQGVPKELCRENSTRRQQIEAEMKAQGLEGAAAAKKVAEDTRVAKRVMEKEALSAKWHKTCENFGWGQKEAAQLIAEGHQRKQESQEKSQRQSASEQKPDQARVVEKRENRAETKGQKTESSHSDGKKESRTETNEQKTDKTKSQEQNKSEEHTKDHAGTKAKKAKHDTERQSQKIENQKIKDFTRDLRKAIDRIYVERQTVERVMKLANRFARIHGVNSETVLKAVKDAKLPKHLGWGRVEYRKLFPKAHRLSPFSDVKLPVMALHDKARKWGTIEKKVVLARFLFHQHELRVQQKHLFHAAPKWSPLHKVTLPALRFVVKRAKSEVEVKLKSNINIKAKEHQHEH